MRMRFRTWPVAALGLGGLLVLIAVSMLALSRRAQSIYSELDALNTHHHEVDAKLRLLRSDVNLSGIFVRDYLLDVASEHAADYRQQLSAIRQANMTTLAQLRALAPGDHRIDSLLAKLEDYWETFEPLFDWTLTEKIFRSARFLRNEVVPRRDAVLAIAQEIEELNNANLGTQRAEVTRRYDSFRQDFHRLLWQSLLLGLVVALTAVFRLRVLERRSEEQREIAEEAERRTRLLSQRLVAAQEEERRNLSRELHDHIAQVLTALKMEIGRIDRAGAATDIRLRAVAECRQLVDEMFRTVRDLALGLRPSMLDDFGLRAALEWHARDLARRFNVEADLKIEADVDDLPDAYRTCIYRVVQEATTNSIRHAKARLIQLRVSGGADYLAVVVTDDGVGLDPAHRRDGLGLRGIEERVKELDGTMSIHGVHGRGTQLIVRLPISGRPEATLARAAG